jgi:hypothetical protein
MTSVKSNSQWADGRNKRVMNSERNLSHLETPKNYLNCSIEEVGLPPPVVVS